MVSTKRLEVPYFVLNSKYTKTDPVTHENLRKAKKKGEFYFRQDQPEHVLWEGGHGVQQFFSLQKLLDTLSKQNQKEIRSSLKITWTS